MLFAKTERDSIFVVAGFLLLAMLWGGSFVAIDAGLGDWPPLLFAGARYFLAGGAVLAYAVTRRDAWRPREPGEYLAVGVAGVFIIGLYHGLLYVGELYVSGAVAAVVVSLTPVLTAGAATVLVNRPTDGVEIGGFALGVLGVVVVANPTPGAVSSDRLVGVGLIFLATVAFSIGGAVVQTVREGLSTAALNGWAMVLGGTLLLGGATARGESVGAVGWSPTAVTAFVYLTVGSGVIAWMLYFALLNRVEATELHLVGYLEPVVAAGAGWMLLGYATAPQVFVGFALVLGSFVVVEREQISAVLSRRPAVTDSS